ncbi:MAG: PEP-dependent dihydroxyacetone kinase, ADP-binding subunit DhaL [Anaerolineae bacterium]|nr:PEP-dependent dihydroxyacetone kinase, ADP-binding subunit DhaL [Anaerolineae bacterium]
MSVSRDNLLAWINKLQEVYAANKEYLTQLDSAIGDADHGINMNRGFTAAKDALNAALPDQADAVLKTVAMTLIKTVGGASGPLYGTFFMRASAAIAGKSQLEPADVVEMFDAGVQGILQRGKAQLEDKTMVDAWLPALDAMKSALNSSSDLKSILKAGAAAAEQGMKNTIPLQAKKGRASYLGERSIGHQDPGATSTHLMLQAAANLWG